METQKLIQLYRSLEGCEPVSVQRLPGAGSNRQYYRLTGKDGKTLIGCVGTSAEENQAFFNLSLCFAARHLPVPAVYDISDDHTCYLMEDLGDRSLFDFIRHGREKGGAYDETEELMLQLVMRDLPQFQFEAASDDVYQQCYPVAAMDDQSVQFDLNYFKYCYLKLTGLEFNEIRLEADFQQFKHDLLAVEEQGFMYRDFQARNVMLKEGRPYYIDYQGGRRGPIYYDVASFLWQASAHYSDELRNRLIDAYLSSLEAYIHIDRETFMQRLRLFVLFRTLQVLGAYGFRGLWEKKQHFIDSIPAALENLRACLAQGTCDAYPYLKETILKLQTPSQPPRKGEEFIPSQLNIQPNNGVTTPSPCGRVGEGSVLTITIYSFSYKKGIPADESGNGGGYVFDCRSTNNPGRYEQYKQLTGLDKPVIDFLEQDGEILTFLQSVYRLADFHVQRYLDRGFTHLQFAFGCTGGQHRSVYSAQHLAEHLHARFPVNIQLIHREQGITQNFTSPSSHQGRVGESMGEASAFILAAGLGTRLRPLTDTMPKALVPVAGKPLLQHQIERLRAAGFQHIVVNVHHFADQIIDFLRAHQNFGLDIRISDERDQLLETGGAIKRALPLFPGNAPILVHNVDILHNLDLAAFYRQHANEADATLLVSQRSTSRYLLTDNTNRLLGWRNVKTGEVKGKEGEQPYAFSGIHIFSPSLGSLMENWQDRFSVIDFYLQATVIRNIRLAPKADLRLLDVGKVDSLQQAEEFSNMLS